jgi:nickel/cobalt exporter
MRARILGLGAALAAIVACIALFPAAATAHPLGNFSTNQLVQVRIDERQARVAYILDQAEIPTFQQIQRYDADGDGTVARAERAPLLDELLGEASAEVTLTADGRSVPLGKPSDVELSFPPGQSGLVLTRLEAEYAAPLPRGVERVEIANAAFGSRVGWRAVQIVPGQGTNVTSSASASDPTNGLRTYPEDLLSSPPDERRASFEVEPGDGAVTAPGPDGEPVTTQGPADGAPLGATGAAPPGAEPSTPGGFAGALTDSDARGLVILLLIGAAFGWGALHALSPGHGKAMIAGYLAGSRGTPRDAVILGATVTVTHTAAVFAFGLVTLAASEYIVPERLYPWLGLVSGLMVIAIGFAVMRSRFRRWRALRADATTTEHAHHDHHHDHDHAHSHDHGHSPDHGHSHHHHHHHGEERPGLRGLIGLGVSGGLVPCPSALVVLIAAISQHRVGLGMVLIVAFSMGLAATVTGIGLAVIWGQRLVRRVRPERRLFGARFAGALPSVSAAVIVLAGVLISYRAIPELG